MTKGTRHEGVTVVALCKRTGMTRQAYYKKHTQQVRASIEEERIIGWVQDIRSFHPKQGARKLYFNLTSKFETNDIKLGRDRFIEVLRRHDYLVERRRRYARTTYSDPAFHRYLNQLKNLVLTAPNQAWVSDITYIATREGFLYLSLITDAYTREIVGYAVNNTLETTGCIKALQMALRSLTPGDHPIHHSDRGFQYSAHLYTDILKHHGLVISMTEKDHCAENALAERVNGILKTEYYLNYTFDTKELARVACHQAVRLYNTDRPHLSLNYQTPSAFRKSAIAERVSA